MINFDDAGIKLEDIINVLNHNPDGLPAWKIAWELGSKRKHVIRLIHLHSEHFREIGGSVPKWQLVSAAEEHIDITKMKNSPKQEKKEHWLKLKFQNRENAKTFTLDDFNNLADWSKGQSHRNESPVKTIKTKCGNVIECDSESEYTIIKRLDSMDVILAVGGQALCINYPTHFTKSNSYFPDIVVLTDDNHIGIIEVKPLIAMSEHTNIAKYNALRKYCEEKGFMYMMVDPDSTYTTFEEFKGTPISEELNHIFELLKEDTKRNNLEYFHFTKEDVKKWYKEIGKGDRKAFELQVHTAIILNNWYNTYDRGFKVYSRPVKLRKIGNNYEVVDYI